MRLLREPVEVLVSLIPKSSHHPVFDCFQYAKVKGECQVLFIVNEISVLSRQTEAPTQKANLKGLSLWVSI